MERVMATKSKKKLLYPEKTFEVYQLNCCCGIGEVGMFRDKEPYYDYFSGKREEVKPKYATREEQAEACYREFVEETKNGDDWVDGQYSQVLVSLVSSYGPDNSHEEGTAQFPELEEILLREGWTIYSVFINPNHGNEVTLYGKYFPDRTKHPVYGEE
jgi:hypothetical protein